MRVVVLERALCPSGTSGRADNGIKLHAHIREPMHQQYPGIYRDQTGTETIVVENDGHVIQTTIRGVTFTATMLDDMTPKTGYRTEQLTSFSFHGSSLTDYTLEFTMPIPIRIRQQPGEGLLAITLSMTSVADGLREELHLCLAIGNATYRTAVPSSLFEEAFLELRRHIPSDIVLETCFFCGLSDYSPYGNGLFGCLACFREHKAAYAAVQTKADLVRILALMTGLVQETDHCASFALRTPQTGYRG